MFLEPENLEYKPIIVDENGNWFHGDAPIIHQKILLYFIRHVKYQPEDESWWIVTEKETQPIQVADTPFFIRSVAPGDDPDTLLIRINDETVEPLDLDTVECKDLDRIYCRIKGGTVRARFDPDAMRRLGRNLNQAPDGTYYLQVGAKRRDLMK